MIRQPPGPTLFPYPPLFRPLRNAVEITDAGDAPARAGGPRRAAGDLGCAVHLPDPRAGTLRPQNVRLAVAVEITGADDAPARTASPGRAAADPRCAVHLPDRT